jgi:hypothetical protein
LPNLADPTLTTGAAECFSKPIALIAPAHFTAEKAVGASS